MLMYLILYPINFLFKVLLLSLHNPISLYMALCSQLAYDGLSLVFDQSHMSLNVVRLSKGLVCNYACTNRYVRILYTFFVSLLLNLAFYRVSNLIRQIFPTTPRFEILVFVIIAQPSSLHGVIF